MRIGLDAFTIREISTDPLAQLAFAKEHGFDSVQFDEACYLGTDIGKLKEIVSFAKENDIHTSPSVDVINPLFHKISVEENVEMIAKEIKAYAAVGWHELRTRMGGLEERGTEHRQAAMEVMRKLRSVLVENESRINFENHGDCTTFELIRMIERIGPDIMGINLDTANTMVHAEDPLLAVKRAAPFVHTMHAKDGILFFTKDGITRQGRPAGQGAIEWDVLLPILYEYTPDLAVSIEDHKWLFEIRIFDRTWMDDHPDLTAYELGQLVEKASDGSRRIALGQLPDPDEYESIPYSEQMMDRLLAAKTHLQESIAKL